MVTVYYTVIFMATKNPKRVAAGKKAWRNRGKTGGRGRSSGGGGRRRKPVQRGVSGRVGAFILGVIPPTISGIEAAGAAMASKKAHTLSGIGAVEVGLYRWINNMSNGFLGTIPFDTMTVPKADGSTVSFRMGAGIPKGALWSVAGTGILMMGYDWVASKLAGGRPVKIPFTNYNATGGS